MSVVENLRPVEDYRVIRKRLWNPPNAVHDPWNELPRNLLRSAIAEKIEVKTPPPPAPLLRPVDESFPLVRLAGQAARQVDWLASQIADNLLSAPYARAIQTEVAFFYNTTRADLIAPSRRGCHTLPRHVAMYLIRTLVPRGTKSIAWVGKQFGGRDHSTVAHAVRRIKDLMKADECVAAQVAYLCNRLTVTP